MAPNLFCQVNPFKYSFGYLLYTYFGRHSISSRQNWYILELLQQTLCWQMQIRDGLQESWVFPILDCGIRTHSFTSQRLLPMRLYNATAGQFAPLRYPTGIDTTGLPATRGVFFSLTGRFSTTMGEYGHC